MDNTKHSVTRHPMGIDGWYTYRGVTIKRDDRNRGYWGHWTASVAGNSAQVKITTQTRTDLLKQIDDHINSK